MNETIGEAPRDAVADARMTVKVLERAAELIDQGWCQGAMARDAFGTGVFSDSRAAQRWCIAGSVLKAAREVGGRAGSDLFQLLPGGNNCSAWNDEPGRTADEVSTALRTAAHSLELRDA